MDPKPVDILTVDLSVDIDPSILLSLEFEKMKFVSQLDVESVLSESDSKTIEINNIRKDSETSDTNSECDTEEPTSHTELERKDINGNEETLSDYNLNRLFEDLDLSDSDNEDDEESSPTLRERGGPYQTLSDYNLNRLFEDLDLSDSDSEEDDEESSPTLRERGGPDRNHSKNNQNRFDYLKRCKKYDRSEIDPSNLRFLSGSSYVQLNNASHYVSLENNHSFEFNTNEVFYNNVTNSEPVLTSYPQFYEDSRANSIGSPESGYESSLTGSPPPIISSLISHRLESISQLDDDQFTDYIVGDPAVCALTTDHAVPKQLIDNGGCEKEIIINKLVEFLKNNDSELVEVTPCNGTTDFAPQNTDTVPLSKSYGGVNNVAVDQPPNNVGKPKKLGLRMVHDSSQEKKLGYKIKEEAKKVLQQFLSKDKYLAYRDNIFKHLNGDRQEKRRIKVIHVTDDMDKLSENRTNLHHAVLQQNIEEIYALVEIQKQYKLPLSDLNIRDKYGKTALDYAIQQHMHKAVIDYLKENTAVQSVIV